MVRTSAVGSHVVHNRPYQSMIRVRDAEEALVRMQSGRDVVSEHGVAGTEGVPLLQRHALERRFGRDKVRAMFGTAMKRDPRDGTLHAHFDEEADDDGGLLYDMPPPGQARARSRSRGARGGMQSGSIAWLCVHPSVEPATTVQGQLEITETLMQRASAR